MGRSKKIHAIDITVDSAFQSAIESNLSGVNSVIDSREAFYNVCHKLINTRAFAGVDMSSVRDSLMSAGVSVHLARNLLAALEKDMANFIGVESLNVPKSTDTQDMSEILFADYDDLVAMLKTYMYGSHGKAKNLQKQAREICNTRDILKRLDSDPVLDHMYQDSINFKYVLGVNEILTAVGPYRGIAESLIKSAKTSEKRRKESFMGDNN